MKFRVTHMRITKKDAHKTSDRQSHHALHQVNALQWNVPGWDDTSITLRISLPNFIRTILKFLLEYTKAYKNF